MKRILVAILCFAFALPSWALSPAQDATLLADIQSDPVLSGLSPSSDAVNKIVAAYAQPASPPYVVWRSSMPTELSRAAIVVGAAQLDGLTVGKRDSLLWLCSDTINPADANVRAAISDLTGSQNTLKSALEAAMRRNASRLERLFASGAGTTASPGVMTVEGGISYGDVLRVMGW